MSIMVAPIVFALLLLALGGVWISLKNILMVAPNGAQIAYLIVFATTAVFLTVFMAAALAVGFVPHGS